jgi:proline racemase
MVQAVDAHACGEPGRVIVGGVLDVPGTTMYDKMCYLRDHADSLRKRMLTEPRGYPAANCNLILPSSNPPPMPATSSWSRSNIPGCRARIRSV